MLILIANKTCKACGDEFQRNSYLNTVGGYLYHSFCIKLKIIDNTYLAYDLNNNFIGTEDDKSIGDYAKNVLRENEYVNS